MVDVLDDLFDLPVTSGAVGVLKGRQYALVDKLCRQAVQLLYQAVIQPDRMNSIVPL